jgi:hypothetical protein
MPITAHEDGDARPALADAPDDVPEHARNLDARRAFARPDQRQDRLAGIAFEDVDRLEAMTASVRVEHAELLAAVHEVAGVVDVEHDDRRR